MVRVWASVIAVLATLGFAAWASDFVTMQGERTIYTVECIDGVWQGDRCTGEVSAGQRYRYRALKPHREVIFWTVGTAEPSGKFDDCTIRDGRNWSCKVCPDARRSITLQMAQGVPVSDAAAGTRPFRAVPKWRWMLLKRGFTGGSPVPPAATGVPPG
ncbi:MAG TPA: hypothetical protein VHM00_04120 [Caldimonas sp.]|jgi:hypothetical protein|nr:hypothetical protein [Caldimonas sp.]HEX2540252.1 hypothetical protein [Caldimonas sp.]